MSRLQLLTSVGSKLLTPKRATIAVLLVAGLYVFGGTTASYFSTASRLVSESVHESLPLEFEIERAKTMMNALLPEIKQNMIAIAKEEAGVNTLRQEIERDHLVLDQREGEIKEFASLLKDSSSSSEIVLINNRKVDREYANEQLKRVFERFKWDKDTLHQRTRLLGSQESSLIAARQALEEKLNAKRDLEVELENLDSRLYTVQRETVASNITYDESKFSRCKELVQNLRARLDVAEQLVATCGEIDFGPTSQLMGEKDVLSEIDEFFAKDDLEDSYADVGR